MRDLSMCAWEYVAPIVTEKCEGTAVRNPTTVPQFRIEKLSLEKVEDHQDDSDPHDDLGPQWITAFSGPPPYEDP